MPKTINRTYSSDPIVNAVIEIRFKPNDDLASNFIFTTLVEKFRSQFPTKEETATKSLPKEIIQRDPSFKYQPHFILYGENKLIQIGSNSLSITSTKPYIGWNSFKPLVLDIFKEAKQSKMILSVERLGIRYSNLLNKNSVESDESQFSQINCNVQMGSTDLASKRTAVRSEFKVDDFIVLTNFSSNASTVIKTQAGSNELSGLLVDIDVIKNGPFDEFWKDMDDIIEEAHRVEKSIFFDIVKQETMDQYD